MKLLYLLPLLLCSCLSYTRPIGSLGCGENKLTFHKVQLGSMTAPGQTVLVVEDASGKLTIGTPLGGNGILPGVPQAAGLAALGAGIAAARPHDTDVNSSVDNDITLRHPWVGPKPPRSRDR